MANVYMGTDVEDFIFGEGTVYESDETTEVEPEVDETETEDQVEEQVTDEEMNVFGVIECFDDPEVACYRIALENEQNYNMIMNAFMVKEFSVLESTGTEMVYEAADVKKYFDIVVAAIARFWSKIQGIFKKLMDNIAAHIATNKAFVKKYKGVEMKRPETDKEFKGYNFTDRLDKKFAYDLIATKAKYGISVSKIGSMTEEEATAEAEKHNQQFEDKKADMRRIAVRGADAGEGVTADDFDKDLFAAFFGSNEKEKVALPEFDKLIADLEKAQGAISAAKGAYKNAEASIKTLRGEIKIAQKELAKKEGMRNPGMKVAKCLTDSINASLGIMSKTLSVHIRAITAKVIQDRAMAAYYVTHQPKAAKVEEAAEIDDLGITLI